MDLSRRELIVGAAAAFAAAGVWTDTTGAQATPPTGARTRPANEPFGYCLNTSTIRGNNLDFPAVVAAASAAE